MALKGILKSSMKAIKRVPIILKVMLVSFLGLLFNVADKITDCHKKLVEEVLAGIFIASAIYNIAKYARLPQIAGIINVTAIAITVPTIARAANKLDDCECIPKMYPGSEIPNIKIGANLLKTIYGEVTPRPTTKQLARLLASDPRSALHERKTAADLENLTCSKIIMLPVATDSHTGTLSPDFRIISNKYAPYLSGKTGDFMYTGFNELGNTNFTANWERKSKNSFDNHIKKADYLVLDLRKLNLANRSFIYNYINTLTIAERNKLIVRR